LRYIISSGAFAPSGPKKIFRKIILSFILLFNEMVLAIFRTYIAYILRKLKIRHLGAPFYEVIEVFSLKQKYA